MKQMKKRNPNLSKYDAPLRIQFDRAQWTRMSKVGRKLADEYYKEKYGKSVSEMQKEEPDTNHFYIGKTIGNSLSTAYQ